MREAVIGNGPPVSGGASTPEVQLALPSREALPGRGLEQLQLDIIVRRPHVLNVA